MDDTILRSKRRQVRRWPYITAILVLAIALLATLIWGLDREQRRANRAQQVSSLLTQSYYELVDGISNMNNDLMKLMVSASPGTNVQLLSRLSSQAQTAAGSLAGLPGGHSALVETMGFLNKAGDLCASFLKTTGSGTPLSQGDLEQLDTLTVSCQQLYERLSQLDAGQVLQYEDTDFYEGSPQGSALAASIGTTAQTPLEYPSLIYDGPFSDGLKGAAAKGLEQENEVDEETARQRAAQALGKDIAAMEGNGSQAGQIESYLFTAKEDDASSVMAAITRKGGKLLWIVADRQVGEETLTLEQAEELAAQAAQQWGFGAMRISWSQKNEGIATISLIAQVGEVGIYPDMLKVKVALDDGSILGMDATGYWMNHVARDIPAAAVLREEARTLVSPQLMVSQVQLAIVPTDGGGEKLCWEVAATFGNSQFFVYLDAQTGREVNIFRVIETEEGVLTMQGENGRV